MTATTFRSSSRHPSSSSSTTKKTRAASSGIARTTPPTLLISVLLLSSLVVIGCSCLQPQQQHRHVVIRGPHRHPSHHSTRTRPTTATANMASSVAAAAARNTIGKLYPSQSVLLLCDVQERFRPLIHKMETVVSTCQYMTSVCQALDVPIMATQQYTKVFGPTITDCFADGAVPADVPVLEKKKFSMLTDEACNVLKKDKFLHRPAYIIVGIEAHVCVQQTCLDLLEQGDKDVHVICDGVSSQQASDRLVALRRLEKAGAFLTTAQSAAFMLMQSAEHDAFKTVSKLTVEHMKKTNEFNIPQGKTLDIL